MARGGLRIRFYLYGKFWVQVDGFDRVKTALLDQLLYEKRIRRAPLLDTSEKARFAYEWIQRYVILRHRK